MLKWIVLTSMDGLRWGRFFFLFFFFLFFLLIGANGTEGNESIIIIIIIIYLKEILVENKAATSNPEKIESKKMPLG